jgi:hypothetical protein
MPWPLGSCAIGKGRLTVVSALGTRGTPNAYNETLATFVESSRRSTLLVIASRALGLPSALA